MVADYTEPVYNNHKYMSANVRESKKRPVRVELTAERFTKHALVADLALEI